MRPIIGMIRGFLPVAGITAPLLPLFLTRWAAGPQHRRARPHPTEAPGVI
jgi:hypothetical protein